MSRGYAGVVNIANDVIVYGCVMEKHEKFLFAVLDRWSEVRLTIAKKVRIQNVKINFLWS